MKAFRVFFNSNPYDSDTDSYWMKELDANKRCNDLNEPIKESAISSMYNVEEIEILE